MKKASENKDATKGAEDKAEEQAVHEAGEARVKALEAELDELRTYKARRESHDAELALIDARRGVTISSGPVHQGGLVKPGTRLYLTADNKQLVPEGHKDARTLYCTEHSRVPRAEFSRLRKA